MLFRILKLLGLDVPAQVEAAKTSLELRVEQAVSQGKWLAQKAAVIFALYTLAGMTGVLAVGIGLIGLYRWASQEWGADTSLAIIGGVLVLLTVVFVAVAAIKGKSLASEGIGMRSDAPKPTANLAALMGAPATDADAASAFGSGASMDFAHSSAMSMVPSTSASDLVQPLAAFLKKIGKYPGAGNPVVDDLIENMGATARGTAEEVIDRAAKMIRYGDRGQVVIVMTGAAFVGWLLTRTRQ
jgi:hypothetical protein